MTSTPDPKSFGKKDWDERRSFDYLLSKIGKTSCPFCGWEKYYLLGRKRLRCSRCRRDYNPLGKSKFSLVALPYSKWLVLIKLFVQSASVQSASKQAGVSLRTAQKVFRIARRAILEEMARTDNDLKKIIGPHGRNFGSKRDNERQAPSFFGLCDRKGKVSINLLPDVTIERLFEAQVKKVRRGNIVYTERWRGYDSVLFYGFRDLSQENQKTVGKGLVYLDRMSRFWSISEEKLMRFRPCRSESFLPFLKEMEWRYNKREEDLVELLVGYLLVANRS